jgi:hypothetical protein
MFAPDRLHRAFLYQISRMNTPVAISTTNARLLALSEALIEFAPLYSK